MAIVSFYNVICECGHKGQVKLRENDTPYSNRNWEEYSLIDLDGSIGDDSGGWDEFFSANLISCPQCKSRLTRQNLK